MRTEFDITEATSLLARNQVTIITKVYQVEQRIFEDESGHESTYYVQVSVKSTEFLKFLNHLTRNTSLKSLNLSGQTYSDEHLTRLADTLKENKTLETLIFDNNKITKIPSLILNSCIQSLSLKNNLIHDSGVKDFMDLLKSETCKLKELDLSSNRLTAVGITTISQTLVVNKSLETLKIASNLFSGTDIEPLIKVVSYNPTLKQLNVGTLFYLPWYNSEMTKRIQDALTLKKNPLDGLIEMLATFYWGGLTPYNLNQHVKLPQPAWAAIIGYLAEEKLSEDNLSIRIAEGFEKVDPKFFYNHFPDDKIESPQIIPHQELKHSKKASELCNYVIMSDYQLIMGLEGPSFNQSHIALAQGYPIRAGGRAKLSYGTVVELDNGTGHYLTFGDKNKNTTMKAFKDAGFTSGFFTTLEKVYIEKEWKPNPALAGGGAWKPK